MPEFRIVLVRPEHQGNVGAVARSMSNFGFSSLFIVSGSIGEEARRRAKHGNYVLDSAVIAETLSNAVDGCDYIVGTTGIRSDQEKNILRSYETPRSFAERVKRSRRSYALLFGPEGLGLSNEELSQCDYLVSIPTTETYPVMNLSHAVTVLLYELYITHFRKEPETKAVRGEKDKLNEYFSMLLERIDFPEHRKEKTALMFRRLIARASLTKWEFYTLMGVFSRTLNAMGRKR